MSNLRKSKYNKSVIVQVTDYGSTPLFAGRLINVNFNFKMNYIVPVIRNLGSKNLQNCSDCRFVGTFFIGDGQLYKIVPMPDTVPAYNLAKDSNANI